MVTKGAWKGRGGAQAILSPKFDHLSVQNGLPKQKTKYIRPLSALPRRLILCL